MILRLFARLVLVAVFGCFYLLSASGVRAQETGSIVGTVMDASGAVVPGAAITVTNTGTNISQTTQAGADGNYVFTLLQVGNYSVKAQSAGFNIFSAPSIAVSSGDRVRVDVKLEVGNQSTTVEVKASIAAALETDTSTVGQLTSSQNVEDLPLNGRNIIKLVQLAPGVTEGLPGSIGNGRVTDDQRPVQSFSVNGQPDYYNNNLIDGMDNNERSVGNIGVRPSIDAIQEVNVQTNKYDASVGHTGGGVVNIITKSGTNGFHGTAYEFFRNKVLNTNPNWAFTGTSAPNPPFRQNQYGGSIGGPIKKDKTFFFFDYEVLDYVQGIAGTTLSVPTYCERGLITCPDGLKQFGDFSDINPVSAVGGGSSQPAIMGPSNIGLLPLCSGNVQTPANAGTCLSLFGVAHFNMYPLPTCGPGTPSTCTTGPASGINAGTSNNYTSAPTKPYNSDAYDMRIDQHFNDSNTLYGRFTHNGQHIFNPSPFPNVYIDPATGNLAAEGTGLEVVPALYSVLNGPNHEIQNSLGLSFVHVFNPNLLLNLKVGAYHAEVFTVAANQGTDITNKLGVQCTATACVNAEHLFPGLVGSGLAEAAIGSINGSNTYGAIGDNGFDPESVFDTSFQYLGTVTWNHGPHSIRFGLGLIRRRVTVGQSSNAAGTFSFNGSYTGVALGDLLEGLPYSISRANSLDQPSFRTWEPSIFVQDDWRARPWLTLNLGFRYDIFTPYTEVHGRISNYNPYTGLVESPALPGLQQSSPTAGVPTPLRDFAPRIGFAATLSRNTVLRGGFGLSYFPVNYLSQYYMKNAPFNYSASCQVQNGSGTNIPCSTATFNGAAGQFSNGLLSKFGNTGSSGTVNEPGGALLYLGLPTPVLNIALATNTANYKTNGAISSIPTNLQEAYVEQWNLGLQKQFWSNVLDVEYVGHRGVHLAANANQNLPANPTENTPTTLPMTVGGQTPAFGLLQGYPYFSVSTAGASEAANIGSSMYNALQVSLVRRFSHGLTANVNYVWAHALENTSGSRACVDSMFATPTPCWVDEANGLGPVISQAPPNPPLPFFSKTSPANACAAAGPTVCRPVFGWQMADWGNGNQDVRNRISWEVNYELPYGNSLKEVEGVFLKGWGVNTSGSWQTGLPFSVTPAVQGDGISGIGYLDQTCSGRLAHPTLTEWFNYNCFVQPTPGTIGNEKPNQFFGPHQKRLDASLFKEFPLKERLKLQFRAEVFNLFNSTNFNTPAGTSIAFTGTSSTGVPNSVGPVKLNVATPPGSINAMNLNWNQREIQFALKLLF